ncbi:MAG: hypothetical protein PVF51_11975 [Nitrospirota bacterium]|jgi:hypothetical protein
MLDGIQSAIQGIRGAVGRQADAARHIAEVGAMGIKGSNTNEDPTTRPVTPAEEDREAHNDADLARGAVEQIAARHEVQANVASLRAQRDAEDHLLDLFA